MQTSLSVLDQVHDVVQNRHAYAESWKRRTGGKVAGYFCMYVPEEIMYAAGVLPVRVLGSHETQHVTQAYIPTKWCPFCRDCLAQGLQGRYDYLDGVIYAHSCMHAKLAFFSWAQHVPTSYTYECYVPRVLSNKFAKQNLAENFGQFKESVEKWTSVSISDERLATAIGVYDASRRLLRELYETRKADSPPITGADAMEAVLASILMDKQEANVLLKRLLEDVKSRTVERKQGIRIMLLGSENDDISFVRMLESLGVDVVIDDICVGSRYFWNEVGHGKNLLMALASRYADRPPCPNKDPVGNRRITHVTQLAKDYRIQGAILLLQKFCDPHQWQTPEITSKFEQSGIPTLVLESDVTTSMGQLQTRIEAFLEMIEAESA